MYHGNITLFLCNWFVYYTPFTVTPRHTVSYSRPMTFTSHSKPGLSSWCRENSSTLYHYTGCDSPPLENPRRWQGWRRWVPTSRYGCVEGTVTQIVRRHIHPPPSVSYLNLRRSLVLGSLCFKRFEVRTGLSIEYPLVTYTDTVSIFSDCRHYP